MPKKNATQPSQPAAKIWRNRQRRRSSNAAAATPTAAASMQRVASSAPITTHPLLPPAPPPSSVLAPQPACSRHPPARRCHAQLAGHRKCCRCLPITRQHLLTAQCSHARTHTHLGTTNGACRHSAPSHRGARSLTSVHGTACTPAGAESCHTGACHHSRPQHIAACQAGHAMHGIGGPPAAHTRGDCTPPTRSSSAFKHTLKHQPPAINGTGQSPQQAQQQRQTKCRPAPRQARMRTTLPAAQHSNCNTVTTMHLQKPIIHHHSAQLLHTHTHTPARTQPLHANHWRRAHTGRPNLLRRSSANDSRAHTKPPMMCTAAAPRQLASQTKWRVRPRTPHAE